MPNITTPSNQGVWYQTSPPGVVTPDVTTPTKPVLQIKMPRVGEQLAPELDALSAELGHPGIEALWIAARRRKLAISKKRVQEYKA